MEVTGRSGQAPAFARLDALLQVLPLPQTARRRVQRVLNNSGAYLGNASIAFLIRVVGAGVAFALQVILARCMSLTDYGLYVAFWTWLFVAAQMATLGFNDSCLRFLPRYLTRGRFDDAHAFLAIGYRVVVGSSLAITGFGLAILWAVQSASGAPWLLVSLFLCGIPFLAFEFYLEGLARSFGWFVLSAAPAYILRPIVLAFAAIAVMVAGYHLNAAYALGAAVAVTGLMTIGQATILRRRIRHQVGLPVGSGVAIRKKRRLWLAATLPLTLVYGVEEIYLVSDVLLLSLLAEPSEVGIYFAAVRLMMLAGYVYYAFMLISSREFSLARANRDHADLQFRVRKATAWTFWLTVPTVLVMLALGHPLLAMFGSDYESGYGALAVLGLGLVARASVGQAGDLLVVLGHQRANLFAAVTSLVLNAVLVVALVPFLGILGAAIGTACSHAVRAAMLAYLARRHANLETFVLSVSRPAGRSAVQATA
jgi:O-antigen/teichoic acid export membrane protein